MVVTRYFGGVKLGAGGLVRAYSNAAAAALDRAELARCVKAREIFLSMPFNLFRQAERLCDRYALQKKTVFSTQACLNLLVEKEKTQAFLDELSAPAHRAPRPYSGRPAPASGHRCSLPKGRAST